MRDSTPLRLAAFAALGLFGALHWVTLVVQPPRGRALLAVLLAVAGGGALAGLPRLRARGFLLAATAALVALAALALGLVAAGLPARQLTNLGLLGDGLDRGLAGLSHISWPYAGADPWVRRTLLFGLPALLAPAAALAFWPARRGAGVRRFLALLLLLLLYGVPATEHQSGEPLLQGFLLLMLVAAWLWLPRLSRRDAAPAAAVVVAVGMLSLPLAAGLDAGRPWWDYTTWNPFGGGKDISFDWNHSYGPLNWPREGTTLLNVRTSRPHYWKTETLDRFDGFRWLHSQDNSRGVPQAELPAGRVPPGGRWSYHQLNPRWDTRLRVTVRSLRSDFVIGAGTTYAVNGAGSIATSSDGTTVRLTEPLRQGDSYTVRAYVPDPTPAQMRGAPAAYPETLTRYTALFLPRPGDTASSYDASPSADAAPRQIQLPLRGTVPARYADRSLLASPYARTYRLARRLTAGARTEYDAVQRIQRHLRGAYIYDESPPRRPYPLEAFLFRDRRGYCQQFSGAMALMLRMVGIPTRVSAGFSPGSHNTDTGEYRVRDLDAHSWVEVYFPGIGWATFDPTPAAAPAQRPPGPTAPGASSGPAGFLSQRDRPQPSRPAPRLPDRGSDRGSRIGFWPLAGIALLALGAAAAGLTALRSRRVYGQPASRLADAQLRELERALRRLGWRVPGGATLLGLERRLARTLGPAPARYLARLRAYRYADVEGALPGQHERRAFRRALTARRGLRGRLLGLMAIPPGGPRLR